MARIAGVDIPREKRLEISLTYIFGVGRTTARQVCEASSISPTRVCATSPTRRSPGSAPRSTRASRSRVTCAARSRRTSSARSRSAATRASATAAAFPCGASGRAPTPAPARARRRPSPARSAPGSRASNEDVGSRSSVAKPAAGRAATEAARAQERRLRHRAHQVVVQQHDHHDRRPAGEHARVGVVRQRGLQGLAQVDAVRRAARGRDRGPAGDGARRAQGRRRGEGPGLRS